MQIDRLHFRETEQHVFTAEASQIGLKPGEWPTSIETKIGNGRPFRRMSKKMQDDGETIAWVTYIQEFGNCRLRIFND